MTLSCNHTTARSKTEIYIGVVIALSTCPEHVHASPNLVDYPERICFRGMRERTGHRDNE